jgi:hypothetical protein
VSEIETIREARAWFAPSDLAAAFNVPVAEGYVNTNAPETVVHACPPSDDGLTPCCGKTPFEFPATDRMTLDMALVTCQRRRNSAETGA